MDLDFILISTRVIFRGMGVTIFVTVASMLVGLVVGIPLGIARTYGNKFVQTIIKGYETFFRGTPLIVVLFIFYFGLRNIGQLFGAPNFRISLEPFSAAILSLGLICGAYLSMVFRGAIQSISKDQYNAARSLGMSRWQAIFNIILVQAFRLSLPGISNEFTIILKDSPITYAVAIPEMLTEARGIIDSAMGRVFFEVLIPVAILYYILFKLSNILFNKLSKKFEIPGFEAHRDH